jgi:hypothetical protein
MQKASLMTREALADLRGSDERRRPTFIDLTNHSDVVEL